MTIAPVQQSALNGIRHSLESLRQTADNVANASVAVDNNAAVNSELAAGLVQLSQDKQIAQANAKFLEIYNETLGGLIDIFA